MFYKKSDSILRNMMLYASCARSLRHIRSQTPLVNRDINKAYTLNAILPLYCHYNRPLSPDHILIFRKTLRRTSTSALHSLS
jgi:hypothetical protein